MKAWMKGMSRLVSLTLALGLAGPLLLAMPDRAAAVDNYEVVEDFPGPSPSGWTSSSGITSMSASPVAYEGAYSLALDFALDASTTTASVSKTLPGVDASVYNGLQFRLKGPDVVGSYTFKVTTATGTWQTAPMQFGSFDFTRIFLPWSGFRKSGDLSVVATAADMSSVSQMTFQIGRRFGGDRAVRLGHALPGRHPLGRRPGGRLRERHLGVDRGRQLDAVAEHRGGRSVRRGGRAAHRY
ncbi:hypothetical protein [Cohnella rhizosphaerae]|uniref:Uncharacterized protein n=1 Tax=Cohnella rhizosphaerae TaxID=1457232 RepID=A0A9X4KVN5_9BACL|nr:hypothetical protein [Cohnella rhizosphaerae]MDG0811980.1 hypothetical protein [Cohnella rhizosphaerae]